MAKFHLDSKDIIFLRGAQEEMFLKLLQLQTAPNPCEILQWMFAHGVDKTIRSSGFKLSSGDCLSLIHISEPTRLGMISYADF